MVSNSSEMTRTAKSPDIYALGHAVVDAEFLVTPEFLDTLGYQAGSRYLLPDGPFRILNAALQAPGSSATWTQQSGGGSAANTLVTAQRLGARCALGTRLARDAAGWFFAETLQNDHVALPGITPDEGLSGQCLVLVTPDGERTMILHLGVTAEIRPSDVTPGVLTSARCLLLEGYLATTETACQTAEHALELARRAEVPIALSLSDQDVAETHRARLQEWLADPVYLLLGNAEEARRLTGTANLNQAVDQLRAHARQVVITQGAEGALIAGPDTPTTWVNAPEVRARSTLGAGDTFAGALLYGQVHREWDLTRAATFAVQCAARKVEFNGPRLASEQLQGVLQQFEQQAVS